jgi:hypothetical protein
MTMMNSANFLLAAFEPLPQWLNFLAMAGAILLVAFASFLWYVLFHQKRPSHRKHHHRQRRERRKLNPTLAETGGLPPVREEKPIEEATPPP